MGATEHQGKPVACPGWRSTPRSTPTLSLGTVCLPHRRHTGDDNQKPTTKRRRTGCHSWGRTEGLMACGQTNQQSLRAGRLAGNDRRLTEMVEQGERCKKRRSPHKSGGLLQSICFEQEAVRRPRSPAAHQSNRAGGGTRCIGPYSRLANQMKCSTVPKARQCPDWQITIVRRRGAEQMP